MKNMWTKLMWTRDSQTFFVIDPLWYSLMPHRLPMDSLVSDRPQAHKTNIPTYGFILSRSGITGNPQRQS
ncbi:hypothetical protein T06_9395 [Trichinella sp. T6]|nr:hypothetical protein T06_9395 [Trichinella sp. T6]